MAMKQAGHFLPGLQPALSVGKAVLADVVDRASEAQTCEHICHRTAGRAVHQHIADRNHRQIYALRECRKAVQSSLIPPVIAWRSPQKTLPWKFACYA